jgi:hypothetical protein
MTRAHASGHASGHAEGGDRPVIQREAVVRWRVGAEAARRVFETRSRSVHLAVRVREVEGGAWQGEALLETAESGTRTLREGAPQVRWIRDEARGLVHIEAPSLLSATIAVEGDSSTLLYARTDLLGEFGLAGGRYEPEDGAVRAAPRGEGRAG